jgi:hypothetical protein
MEDARNAFLALLFTKNNVSNKSLAAKFITEPLLIPLAHNALPIITLQTTCATLCHQDASSSIHLACAQSAKPDTIPSSKVLNLFAYLPYQTVSLTIVKAVALYAPENLSSKTICAIFLFKVVKISAITLASDACQGFTSEMDFVSLIQIASPLKMHSVPSALMDSDLSMEFA